MVYSENTVTHSHRAPGAKCSRGLPLCYVREIRDLAPQAASRNPRCALRAGKLHLDTLPYLKNGVPGLCGLLLTGAET